MCKAQITFFYALKFQLLKLIQLLYNSNIILLDLNFYQTSQTSNLDQINNTDNKIRVIYVSNVYFELSLKL